MKIRCINCGKKFTVETNDNGVPLRNRCDRCFSREREREMTSIITGVGKKKRSWWKRNEN